jgi:hypothetical protein
MPNENWHVCRWRLEKNKQEIMWLKETATEAETTELSN